MGTLLKITGFFLPKKQNSKRHLTATEKMISLILAASAIIIGAPFQFGYGVGVMNLLEPEMKAVFDAHGTLAGMDWDIAWSLTTGLWCIGGMIGAIIGGPMATNLGRKMPLLLNNVFLLTGAFLQAVPLQSQNDSYDYVLAGRFINGIGAGVATTVGPMMLTEIAPVRYRGALGSCNQFGVCIGMLFVWIISLPQLMIESDGLNAAAFVLGMPLVIGAVQVLVLPFCPDSPVYLATKDLEQAQKAARFYGAEEPEEKVVLGASTPISDPLFYKPMTCASIIHLSQQLSGINAIMFYSTSIFILAGVDDPGLCTVFVGIINIVFTGISLMIVDKFGRKPLHTGGLMGMCAMITAVGVTLGPFDTADLENILKYNTELISWLAVAFILIFVACFQLGPGPIPWFMTAEFFDDADRAKACSIAAGVNWFANTCVGFLYPLLDNAIGGYTFFIFAVFLGVFIAYCLFFVPETKGKSPAEVQEFFGFYQNVEKRLTTESITSKL